jgi:hypothetical protein
MPVEIFQHRPKNLSVVRIFRSRVIPLNFPIIINALYNQPVRIALRVLSNVVIHYSENIEFFRNFFIYTTYSGFCEHCTHRLFSH